MSADPISGNATDPLSLHKYAYGQAEPVDRSDPSGLFSLSEVLSTIAVVVTLAKLAIVGYLSYREGLPDAVAFGLMAAGGLESHAAGLGIAGVLGVEYVLAPGTGQAALYGFGGVEYVIGPPTPPHNFDDFLSVAKAFLDAHTEIVLFEAWFWNVHNLRRGEIERFDVQGFSIGKGGFFAIEREGNTVGVIFGISSLVSQDYFALKGTSRLLGGPWGLSKGEMASQAVGFEVGTSLAAAIRLPVSAPIGIASVVVNGGLIGAWVGYTYGRQQR